MSSETIKIPDIFGNEQETGLIGIVNNQTIWQEPTELIGNIEDYLPSQHKPTVDNYSPNGFLIYCGGSNDGYLANLERAMPEVSTLDEFVRYKNASRIILLDLVCKYTQNMSEKHGTAQTRIQQRVVDTGYCYQNATRKACHDNFGRSDNSSPCKPLEKSKDLVSNSLSLKVKNNTAQLAFATYLATRNFVTGTGFVHSEGLDFSQKIGGLKYIENYSYDGSFYRTTSATHDGGNRVEIRCSDINLQEWAVKQRIGMAALVLALVQTPLVHELPKPAELSSIIATAKDMNKLILTPEQTIKPTPELKMAVHFMKELAHLVLGKLELYVEEVPDMYYATATELGQYCDMFTEVLNGDRQVIDLADTADWAPKMAVIHSHVERDKRYGIARSLTDVQAQRLDMLYDYIGVTAKNGGPADIQWGYGHRRNNHHQPSAHDIAATKAGSPNTRAGLRSYILSNYDVMACDWSTITLATGEDITLLPGQTELTPEQQAVLYFSKQTPS